MNSTALKKRLKFLRNIGIVILQLVLATGVAYLFKQYGFNESNFIMIYILSVLMVSYLVEGFTTSIIASLMSVLTYSFFFTEPYYSFMVYRTDHLFTLMFMLLSSVITSTLTYRVQHNAKVSRQRERRAYLLYLIAERLIRAKHIQDVANVIGEECSKILKTDIVISLGAPQDNVENFMFYSKGKKSQSETNIASHQVSSMQNVYKRRIAEVIEKKFYDDVTTFYVPIVGHDLTYGVLGFRLLRNDVIGEEQTELAIAIAAQMTMAYERERYLEEKMAASLIAETEHIKGKALGTISDDLRTPLTSIVKATEQLIEAGDDLNQLQRNDLLKGINCDVQWLFHTVENTHILIQMDDGQVVLERASENVSKLLDTVCLRVKKRTANHKIVCKVHDPNLSALIDRHRIKQVLYNLIDNAVKYTPEGSQIAIAANEQNGMIAFTVSDNGLGISDEALQKLTAPSFIPSQHHNQTIHAVGLGLIISQAIVVSHGGTFSVTRNTQGGTLVTFTVPLATTEKNNI